MATSSYDSIYALGTTQIVIPSGATNALLMNGDAGQAAWVLKYASGGTVEIIGVPTGATLSAADLAANSGLHYLLSSTEVLNISGPTRFYLSSTGATSILYALRGRSQGF